MTITTINVWFVNSSNLERSPINESASLEHRCSKLKNFFLFDSCHPEPARKTCHQYIRFECLCSALVSKFSYYNSHKIKVVYLSMVQGIQGNEILTSRAL